VWLGPLIDRFLQKFPTSRSRFSSGPAGRVIAERFDLALRVARFLPQDLVAFPLRRITWLLCASRRYLDRFGTPRSLQELRAHRYLCFARSDLDQRLQARIDGKLQEVDLKPILTSNDDELLLRAVRSGRGVCVFPIISSTDT
jgi:DNA-binding transcriptional LysR family regulator